MNGIIPLVKNTISNNEIDELINYPIKIKVRFVQFIDNIILIPRPTHILYN
jgi:hypothetical protein